MKLRRLFALLTSVAMLHVSVAAGDAACLTRDGEHHAARSGGGAVATDAMAMHGHLMPAAEVADAPAMSAASAPPPKADVPPCEAPTQQHCCDALVGCNVAGAVTSEHDVLAPSVSYSARIREALHDAPASFAPAPEPPPPKA
jgi:hypothetical protein